MPLSTLDPRTALITVDLQRAAVSSPAEPRTVPQVIANAVQLADAFRAKDLPVILVGLTAAPDGSDAIPGRTEREVRSAAQRPEGRRPLGWDEYVPELATHDTDIHVRKRNWGAFTGTELDLRLRRLGVTQVVLAGAATSIGVESTARSAYEHDYNVTLATDAMTDLETAAHDHTLTRIFPRLGETGTTEEVIALLRVSR